MDINYGQVPFNYGIKNNEKIPFKVGQEVTWKGSKYKILRIDKHVYPICLGGGIRVSPKDIS